MSNNLLLAAVIGAAVFMVVKKQGQATAVATGAGMTIPQKQAAGLIAGPVQTQNMMGDMWKSLLGAGFVSVAGSGSSTGLIQNLFGQKATTDGKPISGTVQTGQFIPVLTGSPTNGTDYLSNMFPATQSPMGWQLTDDQPIYYSDDLMGLF